MGSRRKFDPEVALTLKLEDLSALAWAIEVAGTEHEGTTLPEWIEHRDSLWRLGERIRERVAEVTREPGGLA